MDFSNRSVQTQSAAPAAQSTTAGSSNHRKSKNDQGIWTRIGVVAAAIVIAVVLGAAVVLSIVGGGKQESEFVDSSKLQAVFLNTGQVYFGNVKTLNSKYFVLTNIYYLQTANSGSSSANKANSNVTLVKLGCELHEPFDQMVVNRDQVTFWENLQSDGQVAKAVATFKQQNPNGQKCADQSSSSSSNSSNSVQNAGNNADSSKASQ